jgi:hypothetical protein
MLGPAKAYSMLLLLAIISPPAIAADAAGKVISTTGDVRVNSGGQTRSLAKDDAVNAGDTLDTGQGRAQLRFADGGMVALKPGTEFRIDDYNYAGSEDGSERSFFSLLKGGFRAISGAIGHRNPQTYHVKALVATIGIRGTAYQADLCRGDCGDKPDGLHLQTDEGTINVFNDAGSLDVNSGQNAYVKDAKTAPVLVGGNEPQSNLDSNPVDDGFRAGENPVNLNAPPPPPPVNEPPPPPPTSEIGVSPSTGGPLGN